tara:strand:- start:378 stop:632 length:255 start_codon:yes stop_codon:yes gene_type:complete
MIKVRCIHPQGCRVLALGLDLRQGEEGSIPNSPKWKKMAIFLLKQKRVEVLTPEALDAAPKVAKKKATKKKATKKAVKKDADAS